MRLVSSLLAIACGLQGPPAAGAEDWAAIAQRAVDRGCYNCHGDPPRRNVPTLRDVAARYAVHRGKLDPATEQELADRLHHGALFMHVAAHERLTEEEVRGFVRWLVEGAPDRR